MITQMSLTVLMENNYMKKHEYIFIYMFDTFKDVKIRKNPIFTYFFGYF